MNKVCAKSKAISKNKDPQIVQLVVSGETDGFLVKQSTINKVPRLALEVAESTFIECEPKIFKIFLNYLRYGKKIIDRLDEPEKTQV